MHKPIAQCRIDTTSCAAQFAAMDKKLGVLPAAVTIAGIIFGVYLWFQPAPAGALPDMMKIAAVVVIAVSLWAVSYTHLTLPTKA